MKSTRWTGMLLVFMLLGASALLAAQQTGDSEIERLERSVVRITSSADGDTSYGTGCVIGLTDDLVYIVTAAHVVRGDKHPQLEFAVAKGSRFEATVIAQELWEPGLAVLTANRRDRRLSSLRSLPPTSVPTLKTGSRVTIIGNPRRASWSAVSPGVQAIQGRDVILDTSLEEGFSGAPLIADGRMQGLVFDRDETCSSAFHSDSVWLYLSNGILPKGILREATGGEEPEYVAAKRRLNDWGFDISDRAFIDCLVSGHVQALRLFLVANSAYARLPFDTGILLRGHISASGEKFATPAISALGLAVVNNQADIVRELIRAGGFDDRLIWAEDADIGTPLFFAAANGNPEIVQALIEAGADAQKMDSEGDTALRRAAEMGTKLDTGNCRGVSIGSYIKRNKDDYLKCCQVLLKAGADAAVALEAAIETQDPDMIQLILSGVRTVPDGSALCAAVSNRDMNTVRHLLEKGASVDATGEDGRTPLHIAVKLRDTSMIQFLLSKGADAGAVCKHRDEDVSGTLEGWTPLHEAAEGGDVGIAETLMAHGARMNAIASLGSAGHDCALTPLAIAVKANNCGAALVLLKRKADVRVRGRILGYSSASLLHLAVAHHCLEMVRLLLKEGKDPKACCDQDEEHYERITPLHISAQNGDTAIADALIAAGADVNASASFVLGNQESVGYSPLHFASRYGRLEMVKLLLKRGADARASTTGGRTPISQARDYRQYEVVDLLAPLYPETEGFTWTLREECPIDKPNSSH